MRRIGVEQLKSVIFHLMQRHFSDILIMLPFVILLYYRTMKAYNSFPMT